MPEGYSSELEAVSLIEHFKSAFRRYPGGVALVAATAPRGPVGLTLSSVASVNVDPAVLSFSVTRATGSAGGILEAGNLVVHFLRVGQEHIADAFARTGEPRFTAEQGWVTLPTGEPFLPSALVGLRCSIRQVVPVGGSALVLADVLEAIPGAGGDPLLYHDRRYGRLAAEEPIVQTPPVLAPAQNLPEVPVGTGAAHALSDAERAAKIATEQAVTWGGLDRTPSEEPPRFW